MTFLLLVIVAIIGCTCGQDDGELRLVDGRTNTSGRVEIYHAGRWGTICDDRFGNRDANVVCTQLGLGDMGAQVLSQVPDGYGAIFLDELRCTGDEFTLAECPHAGWGVHDCWHPEDVGVECDSQSFANDVRLTGSSLPRSGRLQARYAGEWGSVCVTDDGPAFGLSEAKVACKTLGFESDTPLVGRVRDFSSSWLDNVNCRGNESSLSDCSFQGPFLASPCDYAITLQCLNIGPNDIATASVSLTGGSATSGRLEVTLGGIQSAVCDDSFDARDAQVVCRMLNLPSAFASAYQFLVVNSYQNALPIILDEVNCTGTEASLFECGHSGLFQHNCRTSENVGVFCTDDEHALHHHELRLGGSNDTNTGRIDVQYYGIWGFVCANGWGGAESEVFCRSMNLPFENAQQIANSFGDSTGPAWLSNVVCIGTEPSLFGCRHEVINRASCVGGHAVAVHCEW